MKISASSFALAAGLVLGAGTVALGGDQDCSECRALHDAVERLNDQVSDLKRDVERLQQDAKRDHVPAVRWQVTHSLTYTDGTQHCDADEVVTSYTHEPGADRIRGDCAELRIE